MSKQITFYICTICFATSETEIECHGQLMVLCNPGEPGDERSRPITSESGQLITRAPRWYFEAIGRLKE